MLSKFFIDTDVLIDYLKGRDEAARFLESQHIPMLVSAITVGELYAGVREGKERFILDDFIEYFRVISLNNALAVKGGLFRRLPQCHLPKLSWYHFPKLQGRRGRHGLSRSALFFGGRVLWNPSLKMIAGKR